MQSEAKAKALEQFTDYFVKNYPGPDTIIYNPNWHAPKIFAAAYSAISAALSDQERAVEVKAFACQRANHPAGCVEEFYEGDEIAYLRDTLKEATKERDHFHKQWRSCWAPLTPRSENEKQGFERVLAILKAKLSDGGGIVGPSDVQRAHNDFYRGRRVAFEECATMLRAALTAALSDQERAVEVKTGAHLDGRESAKAIALGAAVLTRIEDPAVREIAIRNALAVASDDGDDRAKAWRKAFDDMHHRAMSSEIQRDRMAQKVLDLIDEFPPAVAVECIVEWVENSQAQIVNHIPSDHTSREIASSALVDVPVEPAKPVAYPISVVNDTIVDRYGVPVSPPHREGEDSAEVIEKARALAAKGVDRSMHHPLCSVHKGGHCDYDCPRDYTPPEASE